MANITIDRFNGNIRLIIRIGDTIASTAKVIGEAQARQLLDLTSRLVDPVSSYLEPSDRVFIDNDEYDFVYINSDLFRFTMRTSDTVFIRYDFDRAGLVDFDSKLRDIINTEAEELGTEGPPINEGLVHVNSGPTGPIGPTGPQGPSSGVGVVSVVKESGQSSSDTSLQADDDLFVDVINDSVWILEFVVFDDATSANDLRFSISGPTGSSGSGAYTYSEGNEVTQAQVALDSTEVLLVNNTPGLLRICMQVVAGESGQFRLWWAKGTAAGTDLTFKEGSYLIATRVR